MDDSLADRFGYYVQANVAGLPVSGSTAAPAVFIGALADEPASAEAPREAHGATCEGARGPRDRRRKV
jgi:hypothetical protein